MMLVKYAPPQSLEDTQNLLSLAISVEFATLPPYLYSLYSIKPGTNPQASGLIKSIAMEEMVHMCLACNMLNAIGGDPVLKAPQYPSVLLHIADGRPIDLLPFSKEAVHQGMMIEWPENGPIDYPVELLAARNVEFKTIGQLYADIDGVLKTLPASAWHSGRNQIEDTQFFQGDIFAIDKYDDARRAIAIIVEEGEGSSAGPLDLSDDYAHFYKFSEIYHDGQLTVTEDPQGQTSYKYVQPLGVDWAGAYPAISNPGQHDFSQDPQPARDAQHACNLAYTRLVQNLQAAVTGQSGRLGVAARDMFDLRMAAQQAFTAPLANPAQVSGPAFLYDAKFEDGRAA